MTSSASAIPSSTAAEELWDGVIIGGGSAGLSASLALGRARRRALVIDAGSPRNRFAEHMHTVLGHEGLPPSELIARGRQEAAGYGVKMLDAAVRSVDEADPRSMRITLEDGQQIFARTVIAATGVTDQLPEIPGLAERWGRSVLHCPYCHGWEVRGQRLGVLATSPMSMHQAQLLRQWSDDLTFFSAAAEPLDSDAIRRLRSRGVKVEPTPVAEVRGEGGAMTDALLEDGRTVPVDAIFTGGSLIPHDAYLSGLQLERAETMMGSFIATDETHRTSHPRVWAAGNLSLPMGNVPLAISAGMMAGAQANMALVTEDFDLAEEAAA